MAQFIATIKGRRGEVHRLGTKPSGITAHIAGWNSGIRVVAYYNPDTERDEFTVYRTGGSNHPEGVPITRDHQ